MLNKFNASAFTRTMNTFYIAQTIIAFFDNVKFEIYFCIWQGEHSAKV